MPQRGELDAFPRDHKSNGTITPGVQSDVPEKVSKNLDLQKKLIIFVIIDLAVSKVIITFNL